jgi:hypothetical protein
MIDRQVAELRFFLVAERKSQFGKYFPFSTLAHSEFGRVISLHPCFPSIALLNSAKSRKPIPPSFFALVSFSHLSQCILWLSKELPHQKFVTAEVSFWQVTGANLKQDIGYVGTDWTFAFYQHLMRSTTQALFGLATYHAKNSCWHILEHISRTCFCRCG